MSSERIDHPGAPVAGSASSPFIPHRLLFWLVLIHAVTAWLFHLNRFNALTDHPLSLGYMFGSLCVTFAGLCLIIWTFALLWVAAQRLALRLSPPAKTLEPHELRWEVRKHLILCAAIGLLVGGAALIFRSIYLFIGVLGGLLFISVFIGGLTLIALQRRNPDRNWLAPDSSWPTARVIPPMLVATWSILTVLELMALSTAGNFFNFVDITALVHMMSDEAITMFFGPAAIWFATAIAIFCAVTASLAVFMRYRSVVAPVHQSPPWSRWTPWLFIGLGLFCLFLMPPRERLLSLWYVHPQVASLAYVLSPSLEPTREDFASAEQLYPDKVQTTDPQIPIPETASEYARKSTGQTGARNVLVVFVDTLSRRHLEIYGYRRPVAPNMKALADQSIVFDRARSNGGHTDLATVSLFYSLIPYLAESKEQAYATGHGGMPFHLVARAAGVKVGLFSGDWEVWYRGQSPVFPDRCDAFMDARQLQAGPHGPEVRLWSGVPEHRVVDAFTAWYPTVLKRGERFLGYVKLFRPHLPYYTPKHETHAGLTWRPPFHPQVEKIGLTDYRPTGERALRLETRYDNAIHYADHHLGRLISHLKESGAWENTALILVADHGEAWGEHGWYSHGHQHFEEFLEIPLILRIPGSKAHRDARPVSTIDVAPTVLDLLDLPPYPTFQGRSLLRSADVPQAYWAFSNSLSRLVTLQIDDWKYTQDMVTGQSWLHNLATDPGERKNLAWAPEHQVRRTALKALLYRGLKEQVTYAQTLLNTPTTQLLEGLPRRDQVSPMMK